MRFNQSIIQHLFETKFWDTMEKTVAQDIMELDADEYASDFDTLPDSFELDYIESIHVDNFDIEKNGDESIVSGEMELHAEVNGFAYYDGESFAVGSLLLVLGYAFSFTECDEVLDSLYLEHIY